MTENPQRQPTVSLPTSIGRRDFLYGMGASLGSVALSTLMVREPLSAEPTQGLRPLSPRPGHLPSAAKACIFLMMEGGPSYIDTFDPKPKLAQLHLTKFTRRGESKSAMESGTRYYVESPFRFRNAGRCGDRKSVV